MTIKNIIRNAVKPANFPVITRKVVSRCTETRPTRYRKTTLDWCRKHASDYETFARQLDNDLWQESKKFGQRLKTEADGKLQNLKVNLGGGGNYPLLYFITRWMKPGTIVETGVAAGYSTKAILEALKNNGKGRLYSSDFPYFRLEAPEKLIGILVDDHLRSRWELYIEGDKKNLVNIAGKIKKIDLFHYDSDKTYAGRKMALKTISPLLTPESVIIMDDIQDNTFFRHFIEKHRLSFRVFCFENKYLGITGI